MDALVAAQVNGHAETAGIVAVLIDEAGRHVVAHGHSGTTDNALLGENTVFEIGSLTKVFTALILADMSARGEVAMTDPVAKYLPDSVRVPHLQSQITLIDLATYTSGLPNLPGNLKGDMLNPYADYTLEDLYAFLGELGLKSEPGTHYAYANVGFGLLGIALARRAGMSFEELMVQRICDPLNLRSTRITLTGHMRGLVAQGHDDHFNATPLWDLPALAGAGAARSTARDMTIFLKACMDRQPSPLAPSFRTLLQTRKPTGISGTDVGLGWFVSRDVGDEIVWKSGRTGGFSTNIAFSTRSHRGSVVLANAPFDAISLGLALINPKFRPRNFGALFN
jgi:CubicO group peptidase (beta-lactamase class C family)